MSFDEFDAVILVHGLKNYYNSELDYAYQLLNNAQADMNRLQRTGLQRTREVPGDLTAGIGLMLSHPESPRPAR